MKRLLEKRINKQVRFFRGTGSFAPLLMAMIFMLAPHFVSLVEGAEALQTKIVAEVNQAQITDATLKAEVRSYLRKIGHQELSPRRMAAVERNALKKLIEEELLFQEGLRLHQLSTETKFLITESEIEAEVLKIRTRFPSEQAYEASLLKEGLTVDAVQKGLERALLIRKTWVVFSEMERKEREKRLEAITKKAKIQIYAHPVAMGE